MIDGSVLQSAQQCFEKKSRVVVKMVVTVTITVLHRDKLTFKSGFRVRISSQDFESGFRVRISSQDFELGFRVRTSSQDLSQNLESGFRVRI